MCPARERPGAGQHDEIRHRRAARPGAPGDGPADRRKDWFSEPTSSGDARARGLDRRRALRRTARRRPARGGSPRPRQGRVPQLPGARLPERPVALRRSLRQPAGTYVGHDEPSVEFKSDEPGSGNDITYTIPLPTDPPAAPQADGPGGTLELRAPPDVLVRPDAVRHRVGARVHEGLHAATPTRTTSSARTRSRPTTSASTPATRSWSCSSTARLRAAVRGLRLRRDAVLRGDDDRQPRPRPEHRRRRTTPTATTTSSAATSRSTGPTSRRAATRRRRPNPLFTGTFDNPNLAAVNPTRPRTC